MKSYSALVKASRQQPSVTPELDGDEVFPKFQIEGQEWIRMTIPRELVQVFPSTLRT